MVESDRIRRMFVAVNDWLRRRWGLAFVGIFAVIFSASVSAILIQRYNAFQTAAWDLGVYNQAFFDTVSGNGFFYYTVDLPSGNGGHLFVAHFSPVLAALLPAYAIAPGPPALLVLETVAASLVAIPLYFFARAELDSERWAVLLSGVCLASPVLLGILWYDFHSEALLPLAIISAVTCYRLGSWKLFLVAWFVSLAVIETAAPLLLAFGIIAIIADYRVGRRPFFTTLTRVPSAVWIALVGAVAWLPLTFYIVPTLFGSPGSSGGYSGAYAFDFHVLGASSIVTAIPTALLHPTNAWAALSYDGARKATYLLLFLASFGFLPLFSRMRYFLPGLIWPILAFLSNNGGYYSFGDQYAAYVFPFWALAVIDGVARVRQKSSAPAPQSIHRLSIESASSPGSGLRRTRHLELCSSRLRRVVPAVTIVVLLAGLGVGLALISPLNSDPIDSLKLSHGIPTLTEHEQLLHTLIRMIPSQASVLTTQFLFPEVSNRPNAYVLPVSSYFSGNLTFRGVLNNYVNESDYLLYDTATDPYSASLMQALVNFTGFGIRAEAEGAVLYERGWTQPPQLWTPDSENLTGGSLAIYPAFGAGPNGSYPNVLHYSGGAPNGTQLWRGPFVQPVPGTYRITMTYRASGLVSGPSLRVDVGYRPVLISIVPFEVTAAGQDYSVTVVTSLYTTQLLETNVTATSVGTPVSLSFTIHWPTPGVLDLSGWTMNPAVSVDLYSIAVSQISTT